LPKNKSLNGAIPLLINISVGSPFTTIGAEGTISWPLDLKKSRNVFRTLFDSIIFKKESVNIRKSVASTITNYALFSPLDSFFEGGYFQ
jgi:hypothetical protein